MKIPQEVIDKICTIKKKDIFDLFYYSTNSKGTLFTLKCDNFVSCWVKDRIDIDFIYECSYNSFVCFYKRGTKLREVLEDLLRKYVDYHKGCVDDLRKLGYGD